MSAKKKPNVSIVNDRKTAMVAAMRLGEEAASLAALNLEANHEIRVVRREELR